MSGYPQNPSSYGTPTAQPYGAPPQQPYGHPPQQSYGVAQQPYGVHAQPYCELAQPYGAPSAPYGSQPSQNPKKPPKENKPQGNGGYGAPPPGGYAPSEGLYGSMFHVADQDGSGGIYKRRPQLIEFLNPSPGDCRLPVTPQPINFLKQFPGETSDAGELSLDHIRREFENAAEPYLCLQPNQLNEPNKKKRKTPSKIKSGPVVENEVTERLQKFIIDEMKGLELTLVIQKELTPSDLDSTKSRLSLPPTLIINKDFLKPEEISRLRENGEEIEARLVAPTLEMPMGLKMWKNGKDKSLVLKTTWNKFVKENKASFKEKSKIQLWSFRIDQKLCFALVVVEGPPDGVNSVAN